MTMSNEVPREKVYIIDDSEQVLAGLVRLIESEGYSAVGFLSAESFLENLPPDGPACIVLDVKMPGMSGPALQEALIKMDRRFPVVFLSGHADVPTSVKAMKQGASDFLQKPVVASDLFAALKAAFARNQEQQNEIEQRAEIKRRYEMLSRRERQVLTGVVAGKMNKNIASELGLHEQTIKQHRGSVMRKMHAGSLADLVRMAGRISIHPGNFTQAA